MCRVAPAGSVYPMAASRARAAYGARLASSADSRAVAGSSGR